MISVFNNFLPIILLIGLGTISTAEPELKLVNVVFRHGDRTPDYGVEMYPNDPYINSSFYPLGHGQLTLCGKMREYELGQVLRERYNDFLGDLYLPGHVSALSSDYDRTKMSLQLVLAALFPPVNELQQWHPNLNWQPIPASYLPHVNDNFFLPEDCPQYDDEYKRVLKLPETQAMMEQYSELYDNLTLLTGRKMETLWDLYFLYHTFTAESSMGLTLPKWAYDYFPKGLLFDGTISAYNVSNATPLLKRLHSGPIIRAVLDNMMAAQNLSKPTQIYLYSGHESNIAALLHAYNLYHPHVPEYSSAIILELLQQDKQYYVKLLYYRGIPSIVEELKIPHCETLCPFDKYLDLIQDLIPSDEEMFCKKQTA